MSIIPIGISSKVGLAALKTQKHSPRIMLIAGVVGFGATVVLASRATTKVQDILDEAETKLEEVETALDLNDEKYTAEDAVKDKAIVKFQMALKIAKLYTPAVLTGAASIALLVGSHNVLTKRNAALTAAYAAVEKGFRDYRDRVIEDLGAEKDDLYRYGLKTEKVTEVDENGKKTQVDKTFPTAIPTYGRVYKRGNPNWQHEPESNVLFLRLQQNMLNNRLKAKGWLTLNDVYETLGFERTREGMVVGWLADGDDDNFIDFGIFDDGEFLRVHDYLTGNDGELLLDFNVDGNIFDKI